MVGDVILLQYEGKYKPATYRLGVVVKVQEDPDGLVRTVWVEYSLLSELPFHMRLAYKGITKKRIKVSVQRLVLIPCFLTQCNNPLYAGSSDPV